MKSALIFVAVLAAAAAQFDQYGRYSTAPPPYRVSADERLANTITYLNEIYPDGAYKHAFNTDNGIAAEAEGTPKVFSGNPPVAPVVSRGSFSWISPEGKTILINYIADENGYQPQGDAIPTPPPIPAAIQRSIEYNLKNPQPQQ